MLPLGLGGLVLVACSTVMNSASEAADSNPARLQTSNVSKVYEQYCSKCHGDKGQGGGAGTQSLLSKAKYHQDLDRKYFDAIKVGVADAGMEAFGKTLTDAEVWGQVVHIRELQRDGLRAEMAPKVTDGVYDGSEHDYTVETIIEGKGLKVPWAIDWLKDGRMLITNRPGTMAIYDKGNLTWVEGLPASVEIGQGGLMDVAVHPTNGWIYLGFTDPAKSGNGGMTKIVRGKLSGTNWTSTQTIFANDQSTYNRSSVHFGNRIVFDGKGHVFFSIGERGNGNLAQELNKPNGKIYRVNEDGSIPKDNPFVGKGGIEAVWSYGHRNPQGLTFDLNGNLWDTEHGPRGGDEVNLIQKGSNYGWPLIAHSINYNDSAGWVPWPTADQKLTLPVYRWLPSIGACGLDVLTGKMFPKWKGDLVAGGLSGKNVDRIRVKNGKFVESEVLIRDLGRVREVSVGPDGAIYVALNDPDNVIRLVQKK